MLQSTERVIRNKVALLNLAEELKNVSRACKIMGFIKGNILSLSTRSRTGGIDALLDKNRRKPNLKNRV